MLPDLEAADATGEEFKKPRLEPHSVDYARDRAAASHPAQPLPPREEAKGLFHIYFTYTHYWLPILGKDEMLTAYYRAIELSQSCLTSGEYAALWALLAYAKSQESRSRSDSQRDVEHPATSESYYERARSLIPSEDSDLRAGHVQALLLLSLFKLRQGNLSAAWLLVGQAVNVAIDIGLGDITKNESSGDLGERRNHVFLGCFCLDALIAISLGRCPHLRQEDAILVWPLSESGLEEWVV